MVLLVSKEEVEVWIFFENSDCGLRGVLAKSHEERPIVEKVWAMMGIMTV